MDGVIHGERKRDRYNRGRRTTRVLSLPNSALLFRPFLMKYMAHEMGPDALKGHGFISSRSDSVQDSKYEFPPSPRCIYSLTSPALLHVTQNTDSEKSHD